MEVRLVDGGTEQYVAEPITRGGQLRTGALVQLDSVASERPDDWRVIASRSLALAGLGRHIQAIAECDKLQQSSMSSGRSVPAGWRPSTSRMRHATGRVNPAFLPRRGRIASIQCRSRLFSRRGW